MFAGSYGYLGQQAGLGDVFGILINRRVRLNPGGPYESQTYVSKGFSGLILIGFQWCFSGMPFGHCLRQPFV